MESNQDNTNMCLAYLMDTYFNIKKYHFPGVTLCPLSSNWFEWHFVIKGPLGTPYEGGYYHGKLEFPKNFPEQPPAIVMITPTGRFLCGKRMYFVKRSDISESSWIPIKCVKQILKTFMLIMEKGKNKNAWFLVPIDDVRTFAEESLEFNLNNELFCQLFPQSAMEIESILATMYTSVLRNSAERETKGRELKEEIMNVPETLTKPVENIKTVGINDRVKISTTINGNEGSHMYPLNSIRCNMMINVSSDEDNAIVGEGKPMKALSSVASGEQDMPANNQRISDNVKASYSEVTPTSKTSGTPNGTIESENQMGRKTSSADFKVDHAETTVKYRFRQSGENTK